MYTADQLCTPFNRVHSNRNNNFTERICHKRTKWPRLLKRTTFRTGSYPDHSGPPSLAMSTDDDFGHLSVLPTVVFHPCFRQDILTTAAVFYLTSSGRSARSSLYSWQAGVSGFWCHRLERPASARHSRFSDNDSKTFLFSRSCQDTTVSYDSCGTITVHHYCLDICGPCNN